MFSDASEWNLELPTLGGRQFWGDVQFFRGYRIQQNVLTGHYRLLDPEDIRKAFGTLEECRDALQKIRTQLKLPPMQGRAVVLIHGIVRSSKSMQSLADALKSTPVTVVGFDYPSTRKSIAESAEYLQRVLSSLEGIDEIDVVVHSMGGLLLRTYLQQTGAQRDKRLRRMVMLGTPNHGARMANVVQKNVLFQWVYGPAGQQLVEESEGFIARLPVPDFEFAIIVGAAGDETGWNPLIPGDDDGTISVDCTRLAGASDFITFRSQHSFMMDDKPVIAATLRFLETGALRETGIKQPIPAVTPPPPPETP